jgi:peptidoglycan/xylan/chitin deacetylase (PgdA/CDA1 family)
VTRASRRAFVGVTATALQRAGLLRPVARAAGYVARTTAFQVLAYHRVNDDGDPFFPSIPTEVFARHMAHIADTHTVLPVEVLVERLRNGGLPRNALAITLDDGYRDNLTHAAPILARLGLPATVFLATGFIGTGTAPWFDRLAMALKLTAVETSSTPWGTEWRLASRVDRLHALDEALARLKRLPEAEFLHTVEALVERLGEPEPWRFEGLMLSWDDVDSLLGHGLSVGAHTVTHPILSRLTPERARAEIHGSRRMIEAGCGRSPRAFAYPNGGPADYTETVAAQVREAGFECAVTTRFGLNTGAISAYELRRGGPWERDPATFALKLAGYRVLGR